MSSVCVSGKAGENTYQGPGEDPFEEWPPGRRHDRLIPPPPSGASEDLLHRHRPQHQWGRRGPARSGCPRQVAPWWGCMGTRAGVLGGGTGRLPGYPLRGGQAPPRHLSTPAPPPRHPCAPSTDLAATPPGKSICKGGQSGAPPSLQGPPLSPLARPTPVGNGVASPLPPTLTSATGSPPPPGGGSPLCAAAPCWSGGTGLPDLPLPSHSNPDLRRSDPGWERPEGALPSHGHLPQAGSLERNRVGGRQACSGMLPWGQVGDGWLWSSRVTEGGDQVSMTSLLLPCLTQPPPNWRAPPCSPPGTKPSLRTTVRGQAGPQ